MPCGTQKRLRLASALIAIASPLEPPMSGHTGDHPGPIANEATVTHLAATSVRP